MVVFKQPDLFMLFELHTKVCPWFDSMSVQLIVNNTVSSTWIGEEGDEFVDMFATCGAAFGVCSIIIFIFWVVFVSSDDAM